MGTSCVCDYDGDPVQWLSNTRPRARKEHRCSECGAFIHAGERYEKAVYLAERRFRIHRVCLDCLTVRDEMAAKLDCFCWSYGGLCEDIQNALADGWVNFNPGVRVGLLRLLATHRARNRRA